MQASGLRRNRRLGGIEQILQEGLLHQIVHQGAGGDLLLALDQAQELPTQGGDTQGLAA